MGQLSRRKVFRRRERWICARSSVHRSNRAAAATAPCTGRGPSDPGRERLFPRVPSLRRRIHGKSASLRRPPRRHEQPRKRPRHDTAGGTGPATATAVQWSVDACGRPNAVLQISITVAARRQHKGRPVNARAALARARPQRGPRPPGLPRRRKRIRLRHLMRRGRQN